VTVALFYERDKPASNAQPQSIPFPTAPLTVWTPSPFITGGPTQLTARADPTVKSGCRSLADATNNAAEITYYAVGVAPQTTGALTAKGDVQNLPSVALVVDGPSVELREVYLVNESAIILNINGIQRVVTTWPGPDPKKCGDHELHVSGIRIRLVSR